MRGPLAMHGITDPETDRVLRRRDDGPHVGEPAFHSLAMDAAEPSLLDVVVDARVLALDSILLHAVALLGDRVERREEIGLEDRGVRGAADLHRGGVLV